MSAAYPTFNSVAKPQLGVSNVESTDETPVTYEFSVGHICGEGCDCGANQQDAEYIETSDAAANATTAYTLAGGDTFSGNFNSGTDEDWVEITIAADEVLVAALTTTNLTTLLADVVNGAGASLAVNTFFGSGYATAYYVNTTGSAQTVYIKASDVSPSQTGNYDLEAITLNYVAETTDAEGSTSNANTLTYELANEEVFLASIDFNGDIDLVKVVVAASASLTATMSSDVGDNPLANNGTFNAYVQLYDQFGNLLANETSYDNVSSTVDWFNDTGSEQIVYVQAKDFGDNDTGDYALVTFLETVTPSEPYTPSEVADFLSYGYWNNPNGFAWDVVLGDPTSTITVNITALDAGGQAFATAALEAWTKAVGIHFEFVNFGGDITFDDSDLGSAYANFNGFGTNANGTNVIDTASINIGTDWIAGDWDPITGDIDLSSYSFQTYIHEIGHALGLGHGGPYNGNATYAIDGSGDNIYSNDSWQMTVMSYFSQTENSYIDADFANIITPMLADMLAIFNTYELGGGQIRTGNTVYGDGSNAGGYYDDVFSLNSNVAFTIIDDGGIDHLNLSSAVDEQLIDLNGGAISNVMGLTGNLTIFEDTVIEFATGGSSHDDIIGNSANNRLFGGDGNDELFGNDGRDTLEGGAGADSLFGGSGNDVLNGGAGADLIEGGTNNDIIDGGGGNDTLRGGEGQDRIFVFTGNDSYDGGSGVDWLDFSKLGSGITLYLNLGGSQTISVAGGTNSFTGFENFLGSKGGDTIYATNQNNTMDGFTGNDDLRGLNGNDNITGGTGNDYLYGNKGDDILTGGAGRDYLLGGDGNDTFVFEELSDSVLGGFRDRIVAFEQGSDVIDLSALDAILGGGDDAFTFIGTDKFTTASAGALRFFEIPANGKIIVEGDIDGDNVRDFQIEFTFAQGMILTADDFIL